MSQQLSPSKALGHFSELQGKGGSVVCGLWTARTELRTMEPSGYLIGTEVKVCFLSWRDASVSKMLSCKHRNLSSVPRTYIFWKVTLEVPELRRWRQVDLWASLTYLVKLQANERPCLKQDRQFLRNDTQGCPLAHTRTCTCTHLHLYTHKHEHTHVKSVASLCQTGRRP